MREGFFKHIICGFLFCVLVSANAASQNIDSLKTLLRNAKQDTTRCYILSQMIEAEPDEEAWPKYNDELKSIAEKNLAGGIKDEKLRNFYLKHLSNSLNDQGYSLIKLGDIKTALECYHQSLKINQLLKNKVGMSISFNDLGTIYYEQGDLQKALEFFNKSMAIQVEIDDKLGESNSLNNLGLTYKTMGDIRKALFYYNSSLELQKQIGNRSAAAITLSNIGSVYNQLNDYSKALLYYNKGLAIQEEINDKEGVCATVNNIANLTLKQGKYELAFNYANRGMALAMELGYPDKIRENALLLKNIYKHQHNAAKELEMYELYITMRDSISNETNRKESIRSQFRYEYEKMAAADSVKVAEEKKITVAQLKQERTQRFALYGGLAIVALFAAFMFNRFKVTQKQRNIISRQKEEVEQQRHEAEYQKEQVQVKQKEIIDSITYAKRLQNAILPPQEYINHILPGNFVFYQPKDIVAGDFYWMYAKGDTVFIAAADSTGHGVPGAMVSIVCSNALDKAVKEFGLTDTGKILDKTRELVLETFSKSGDDIKDGMDISLFCLNKTEKKCSWSGANNQLWYVTNSVSPGLPVQTEAGNKELTEIKGDKQPIGNSDNPRPFTTHELPLEPGTLFYLLTDGYADQFGGPKGKKFKCKQLKEVLLANSQLSLNVQKEILHQKFQSWKGSLEQVDDVTIIGIKI
jgi:serine phosphatase RsbU (regulator of sigma subunit)